MIRDRIKRRG